MKRNTSDASSLRNSSEGKRSKGVSQWNIAWRRFKKNKAALVGSLIICAVIFMAVFAPLIARFPPNALPGFLTGETRVPPSLKYFFGTDFVGHDVYSQVVYGAKSALYVGFGAALIAMGLAILVGLVSGYYGGIVDNILMRITEVFLVIPFLLILLVFLKVVTAAVPSGGGLLIVIVMVGLFSWAANARIIRSEVLRVKQSEYIEASKSLGASGTRILFRHLLPNILHTIIVLTTLMIATAILVEAGVSFLGFGDPNAITWGQQLQKANEAVKEAWWEGVFPGL
ncbi:TPA: ABC transporter permease, partial [Candidatus Bathyarchaeota archaeon]|nr:ABC transporter permease [Candidatus Bathyarchaeota archaeon]